MAGERASLLRSAGVYSISNAAAAAISFLAIPVLTRHLSPADYGIVAGFQILVGFLAPVVGLSLSGAVARRHFDRGGAPVAPFVGTCLLLVAANAAVMALLLALAGGPIERWTSVPHTWHVAAVAAAAGDAVLLIVLVLWQVNGRPLQYGALQIVTAAFGVGVSLWLVAYRGMDWSGRLWGLAAGGGLSLVLGLAVLLRKRWVVLAPDRTSLKAALAFGVPLIPHAFGGWVMSAADRLIIANHVSVADAGLYTVAVQFLSPLTLLQVAFNTAWVPWLYERLNRRDPAVDRSIVRVTYWAVGANLAFAVALAAGLPWVLGFVVGPRFDAAAAFVPWLAFARAADGAYYLTCNYLFYAGRTGYVAAATFVASVVHVAATYGLVTTRGAVGAAQASLLSAALSAGLVWWFSARVHPMPWGLERRPGPSAGRGEPPPPA